MKTIILFALATLLGGCSLFNPREDEITPPKLLESYRLPVVPISISDNYFELRTQMTIEKDGTVYNVSLLNSSGDKSWDSAAIASMMKWKYSPAYFNGKPIKTIVHQTIKIKFADPIYMLLGEVLCNSINEADSVYKALEYGEDFSKVALKYSISSSRSNGGIIGKIDIRRYPEEIQHILMNLGENRFTHPISYGDKYIIFKRL
jgi:TonB family protein